VIEQTIREIRHSIYRPWRAIGTALTVCPVFIAPLTSFLLRSLGLSASTANWYGSLTGVGTFIAFIWYLVARGRANLEQAKEMAPQRRAAQSPRPRASRFDAAGGPEPAARDWMRYLGFGDATSTGSAGGIVAAAAVAQVITDPAPVGPQAIEALHTVAKTLGKGAIVFALGGYTKPAVELADRHTMALFTVDRAGEMNAANSLADGLLVEADKHPYRDRFVDDGADPAPGPGPTN